jgi:hypothetical protein
MVGRLLHLNELPLRHLIKQLDGETISENKLAGPIGQLFGGDFYQDELLSLYLWRPHCLDHQKKLFVISQLISASFLSLCLGFHYAPLMRVL